jgi:uncharacterized protein YneF (UPF0154 family)
MRILTILLATLGLSIGAVIGFWWALERIIK